MSVRFSRIRLGLLVLALLALLAISPALAAADEATPGIARGEGTHFAVSGSSYLDVTVDTGVPVSGLVESFPHVVTLHLDPLEPSGTTAIAVGGLAPSTGYYMYVDDFHHPSVLSSDDQGVAHFSLDLSASRLVFIQPVPSTLFVTSTGWSDPSVGTWDPVNRIATLTKDVTQTIQIDADGITLDGGGHRMTAGAVSLTGVYAYGRRNLTIRSLTSSGYQRAIYLYGCSSCSVDAFTATGCSIAGVGLDRTDGVTVSNSSCSGSGIGFMLRWTNGDRLQQVEAVSNSQDGIQTEGCVGTAVAQSVVSGNGYRGLMLSKTSAADVELNTIQENGAWDAYVDSPDVGHLNRFVGNIGSGGLPIAYFSGCVTLRDYGPVSELILVSADLSDVDGVVVRSSTTRRNNGILVACTNGARIRRVDSWRNAFGVFLDSSNDNLVTEGDFREESIHGVSAWRSNRNVLATNTVTASYGGVIARLYSSDNVIRGNACTGNNTGVGGWESCSRNAFEGNVLTGNATGIRCDDTSDTIVGNTISGGGCSLLGAVGCVVSGNDVSGAYVAMNVSRGSGNVVRENAVHDNTFGLELYYTGGALVHSNDFARNAHQTIFYSPTGTRLNLDRPVGGNYWDTWDAPDADGDGFVDVPYALGAATDYLPLARPFHSPKDATPPTTSLALDPPSPDGSNGWYATVPTVTLTASDGDGSGVAATEYSLDGTEWLAYEAPFRVTAEGRSAVLFRSRDAAGNVEDTRSVEVALDTHGPEVSVSPASITVDEGSVASATIAATDALGDVRLEASRGTVTLDSATGTWQWSFTAADGPADSGPIVIRAFDGHGNETEAQIDLAVRNVAPAVTISNGVAGPMLVSTGFSLAASFADPGSLDTHSAVWSWGDGTTSEGVVDESGHAITGSHTYEAAGVYPVHLTVTDDDGGIGQDAYDYYAVVYDPDAGFVTGGGWIISPPGAARSDPSATGKATFGFVSKYAKGATVPCGQTEFQFKLGGLNFHSTSYDWLVVSGTKAQYKGSGTINGTGDYAFILTAVDRSPDCLRMKIWDRATGLVVYDNQLDADDTEDPTTALGGGNIMIHRK